MYTMNVLAQAQRAIRNAETELRQLAADAVKAGEYENVLLLADWAKQLTGISGEIQPNGRPPSSQESGDRRRENIEADDYPQFVRQGDSFVKVGWSKRKNGKYEHRAPRQVIIALIAAFSRAGARKRAVPVEALTPLRSQDNTSIPNYQVYVALSLLRAKGVVEQHGRQGYTLSPNLRDPLALAGELWNSLPSFEGV